VYFKGKNSKIGLFDKAKLPKTPNYMQAAPRALNTCVAMAVQLIFSHSKTFGIRKHGFQAKNTKKCSFSQGGPNCLKNQITSRKNKCDGILSGCNHFGANFH
jgi:hypothetical protein